VKITLEIDISCRPDEVFSWINDPDKAMRWQKGVKSGEILKETSEKIGTRFKEVLEENGKSLEMLGEITDYIPDKLISFHLESKIHRVDVHYAVAGELNKSKVTVDLVLQWKFPMNIIGLIPGHKLKTNILKQSKSELEQLKILCETDHNRY
jgi:hypothetical protein